MTARGRQILLFGGAFVLFFWSLWQLPFLGPDEPRYAQVAREMFESRDFIVPKLGGFVWFEKPVLLYWLMAAAYSIFGVTEFAARLPSAIAAFSSVIFLYFTVRKIADEKTALLSSAVLASCCFFVVFSHAATFDMLLTFCVTAAMCSYLRYEHSGRSASLYGMYAFTGLGILAKGLVAPLVIGLGLGGHFLVSKNWKAILQLKLWQGALITAGVAAIWFLPISLIYGLRFWDEFIYQHHFVRYTSGYYHRPQPFWYYIPILVAGVYPWSFTPLLKKLRKGHLTRFAFSWLLFPFLFFSISSTKLPGYILPVAPAFAILSGLLLANVRNPTPLILSAFLLNVVVTIVLLVDARGFALNETAIQAIVFCILGCTVAAAIFCALRKWSIAVVVYPLLLIGVMIIFSRSIFPQYSWIDSKQLSLKWIAVTPKEKKLVPFNVYDFAPLFYTDGRMELNPQGYPNILTDASQLHRYLQQKGEAHVLALNDDLPWMQRAEFWKVGRVIHGQDLSIVELRPK